MQSSNPVFNRSEGFNGQPATNARQTYPASGMTYPSYDAGTAGYAPEAPTYAGPGVDGGRMTIDSVVQKTAITLGIVVLVAAATWVMTPEVSDAEALNTLYGISMLGALGGFALSMVNSFKRVISPAFVLGYAAFEGLFVGGFSKTIEAVFYEPGSTMGGLVMSAVLGTFAATAGTLAAYKFFNIQVGTRFRTWVIGAMFGFVALSLLNFVLSFFDADFGFNGFGTMGLIASIAGLGLGVLMLILDFDFVEKGIAAGLPERESWRAAFGLTVTIIWIYINLLKILAILRGE